VAVGPNGIVHVVWAERIAGSTSNYELRYTRRLPGDTQFQEPQIISPESSDNMISYHYSTLRLDEAGDPYILWELYPDSFHQRSDGLGIIYSEDKGSSFKNAEFIDSTRRNLGFNGSLQGQLFEKFDVEKKGDLAVVNSRFDPGDSSSIRLYRGRTPDGNAYLDSSGGN
jgi:hypothetical protein